MTLLSKIMVFDTHESCKINHQEVLYLKSRYQTKIIGFVLLHTHVANTSVHELKGDVVVHEPSTHVAHRTVAISMPR